MAFGKGTFTAQDKILPGMYVNVKGVAETPAIIGSRGKVAVALKLNWGLNTNDIIKVTAKEFYAQCKTIFGYDYTDPEMLILREIFKGATEVYVYRLDGTGAAKAKADNFATAKMAGTRGNDIKITVAVNVDDTSKFDVVTALGDIIVNRQIGVDAVSIKDNDYVTFDKVEGFKLETGTKVFTGGTNGTTVTTANHTDFLTKLEAYQVNIVGCVYDDDSLSTVYASWVKNQRDTFGNPLQAVLYNEAADHEGIINVDDSIDVVPWVMGKQAGCALNASLQNTVYDGEVKPTKTYTQSELELTVLNGKFVLHRVGDEYRVLSDINSLVTLTDNKTEDFKYNQEIRVIDQIKIDGYNIWVNEFLGKVPSNDVGRSEFWNRIINLLNEYLNLGAIEPFDSKTVTVAAGVQRGSVVMQSPVHVTTMLEKAYVTIVVQ